MRILLAVFAAILAFFGLFFAVTKWHIHEVTSFCDAARPGTSLETLSRIADDHGIARHWVSKGVFDDREKVWMLFVPVVETFGDIACVVRHDGTKVLSTKMDGA